MSLSKTSAPDPKKYTGKVVMGMDTPGPDEMTIQEIEGKRKLIWDEKTDEEYLDRVRTRAQDMAKEIIQHAMLEAEGLRAAAAQEGYKEGKARADAEIQSQVQAMTQKMEDLLGQIGAQGNTIWQQRHDDLVALIKLAVAKTLGIEMEASRVQSLSSLLNQAVEHLESQRKLTIRCAPNDAETLDSMLKDIQNRNPSLRYWSIKPDPNVDAGGVIVEAEDGMVDNTVATRWAGVEPILDELAIAERPAGE